MRVQWTVPALVAISVDGQSERPIRINDIVETGETLMPRVVPVERVWGVGAVVELAAHDVAGIWWTLLQFGERSTTLLFEKARTHGLDLGKPAFALAHAPPVAITEPTPAGAAWSIWPGDCD